MTRLLDLCRTVIGIGLLLFLVQICLIQISLVQNCSAYSVLTHEEVVDLLWKDDIQPLLSKRFPGCDRRRSEKSARLRLRRFADPGHGLLPFGSKYFSDLTHYVRSGDFIVNLINDATDLNEYAFALGALAHYSADNLGHPTVNQAVGLEFPKLRKKFGNEVTYADNPKAHIRTEFGFDVTQIAKNRYTSDRYHDFIGFEISKPVLERAFQDTYGIQLAKSSPRKTCHWNLPARDQHHHSRDDQGCAGGAKERNRRGNSQFQFQKISLLSFACQLPKGMG